MSALDDRIQHYIALANVLEEHKDTPLIQACRHEDYEAVSELLRNYDAVNDADKFGYTALHAAVRYAYKNKDGAAQIVALLLTNGANINAQECVGESPLMYTVYYNYPDLARLLLEAGADVNLRRTDGDTVISSLEAAPSLVRKRKRMLKIMEEAGGIR